MFTAACGGETTADTADGSGTGGSAGNGVDGAAAAGGVWGCSAQVSAGVQHTCARKTDGTLWCWGGNTSGELGNGTRARSESSPVHVAELGSDVVDVAAGVLHTCARKTDGTLWCWGENSSGQVGDGTMLDEKLSPVGVVAIGSDVARVAVGNSQTCAVKTDGTLWCWGIVRAGDGTPLTQHLLPVPLTALGSEVVEVDIDFHICVRKSDGTLWCWGDNENGENGDGTSESPLLEAAHVAPLGNDVAEVAIGFGHSCARKTDGTLWCWGRNNHGQVGDGTAEGPKLQPVQVAALGNHVVEVSAGSGNTCARKTDGTLWCWGKNSVGELGDGTIEGPKLSPVHVAELGSDVVEVAVGSGRTCARKGDGTLWCWGGNELGQLGDGTTEGRPCGDTVCQPAPVAVALGCP